MHLTNEDRSALVEELAEAMHECNEGKYEPKDRTPWALLDEFYRKDSREDADTAIMPIIERLLADCGTETQSEPDRAALVEALASALKQRLDLDTLEGLDHYSRSHDLFGKIAQLGADSQASGETVAPEVADAFTLEIAAIANVARTQRFARVAMLGALALEAIPYIQGVEAAAAYERWSNTWITTLTAEDMTYARGLMGISEPEEATGDN